MKPLPNFQFLDKSDKLFFFDVAEEVIRAEPKIAIEVYERFMPDKNFYKSLGKSQTYKAMKAQIKAREKAIKRNPGMFYVGIAIEQIMRIMLKADVGDSRYCLGPCRIRNKPMDQELHAKIRNMYFGDNEERERPMENKKERLKKIVREELNKTLKELVPVRVPGSTPEEDPQKKALMGFANIISIEPLQGNDPDAPDAFSRSHKPYKVTLPGGIKYIFGKYFADRDNNMPEKAFLEALGNAPEIPQQFQAAFSKLVLTALSRESVSSLDVGGEYDPDFGKKPDKKPPHAGAYIDKPDGQRVYAKGVNEMKITKQRLKEIIKEELKKTMLNESVANFIKPEAKAQLSTSIPFGSLQKVLQDNPELTKAATNSASPFAQMKAFQKIGELLADEEVPLADGSYHGSRGRLGDLMDIKGFVRYAETKGAFSRALEEKLGEVIKEQRVYIDDAKVGDYMEIMVDDDGRVDGDALPPDDKRIKAQSPGSVDQHIPFKALVQVVAVSKYGEE